MFGLFRPARESSFSAMTRDRVAALLAEGSSITEIADTLALSKSTVCYHARKLGRPADERFAARYDWAAIRSYYEAGRSVRECRARFGFSASGWAEAVARGDVVPRSPLEDLRSWLASGRPISRWSLKRRLVATGVKREECERCGIASWRGRRLPIELHHVNGDGRDNRIENIVFLCPNCHSQTPNFGGRNVKRPASPKRDMADAREAGSAIAQ